MNTILAPLFAFHAATISPPLTRGPMSVGSAVLSLGRLPTDSIGNATRTFEGVNAGSEIRVFLPDGTEAAGVESCVADQVLIWGAYSPGSANNTVRIVIVNELYGTKEFNYLASVGTGSIPIQQEPDKWFNNPA